MTATRLPSHPLRLALPLVAAVAIAVPLASPVAADTADGTADLRSDLDALLADPALEGALSGVAVASVSEGDVLYENEAAAPLIPASNIKLLTTAAALDVLGAGHTFTTTVSAAEAPAYGRVEGDLYLAGTGDPSLTGDAFDRLAARVAAAGVTEVTGDLLADDTWFDTERLAPDWEADDEPYYYAAQISALTVAANEDLDTGVVNVTASPGTAEGDPVDVELDPMAGNLSIENAARTGAPDAEATADITRAPETNVFTAAGVLPAGGEPFTDLRTVHEPTDHAVHLFAAALEERGVKVLGDIGRGTAPGDTVPLAERESRELGALVLPLMKLSNNGHAEILVKAMGRAAAGEGTWAAGLAELGPALERIGVARTGFEAHDGSGLSRTNRLDAATVIDVLQAVQDEPWFGTWERSLPVAGVSNRMVGGTLADRMRGTAAAGNVRAKTGTLSGASSLSGYVTSADGEELAFAVINNEYPGAAPRGVQDAIAVRLAEFSRWSPTTSGLAARTDDSPSAPDADLECSWAGTC
ncbi:D-alanyl-D-alanine carboxypeptidase/D-alanyl-D-alanine-endopeptidase [Nocardiopsis sediminis]|uniref:D-alanyl-D-alanine carboxypeptidase/D-alanyl-D-alanine-endopeptidase n=1 Tax=Nocardiopsis sediminis TaxID=1778267 RepID=A0ABV8FXM2_9ACTN